MIWGKGIRTVSKMMKALLKYNSYAGKMYAISI